MRKKLTCKITAVILCFVFLISSDVWVHNEVTEVYGVTQDEINDAKANAEQIEKQLAEVRQQINALKSQASNTKEYIDKFDRLIFQAQKYIPDTIQNNPELLSHFLPEAKSEKPLQEPTDARFQDGIFE